METIGYLLLAGVGFLALKAFSGNPAKLPVYPTSPAGGATPGSGSTAKGGPATPQTEPGTGAQLVNTSGLFGPFNRMPATRTDTGYFCPWPFVLTKDVADGKYYCYNTDASPVGGAGAPPVDASVAITGQLTDTTQPPAIINLNPGGPDVTATPIDIQPSSIPNVGQLTQASSPSALAGVTFTPPDYVQAPTDANAVPGSSIPLDFVPTVFT